MRVALPLAVLNAAVLVSGVLTVGTVDAGDPTALAPVGREPRPTVTTTEPAPPPVPSAAATTAAPPAAAPAPPPQPAPAAKAPAAKAPAAKEPAAKAPAAKAPEAAQPLPVRRTVTGTGWRPYATVGPVTLHFPGDAVEVLGLHQSGHDGAQPQQPVPSDVRTGLLDSRARDTHPQGAADIVVDPTRKLRSPVTGTVLRAGTYTLYCDHVDHFLVVEPDARPGWEVKLLHFEGLAVGEGDRVEGGVTVVGSRARVLPFASQVDKHTAAPHWPHVHIEVVDPSVPDRPSGRGCG